MSSELDSREEIGIQKKGISPPRDSLAADAHLDKGPTKRVHRTRLSSAERRQQIAGVTLSLMARHGLNGTTVSRIAEGVSMEAPSLYAHYTNRQEMLLAAMDALFERVEKWLTQSQKSSVLEQLQEIGESHASFMASEFDGFVIPTFEFITAPRDTGLSEAIGQRQLQTIDAIAALVDKGKAQGTIREDVDSRMTAYELMICAWAEDVSQLMGIDEFLDQDISKRVLRLFLRSIAVSPELVPDVPSSTKRA